MSSRIERTASISRAPVSQRGHVVPVATDPEAIGGTVAVSIDGDAYTSLENAFKYEKAVVPQCSCRKPGQSWAEALVDAERLLGEGRKGDIIVTPEKAEELSRPQQPGQPAAKGKAKGKAAAFDPEAMKRLLEEQKRAADAESARERDMGARAPTAGEESSGIDFRRD